MGIKHRLEVAGMTGPSGTLENQILPGEVRLHGCGLDESLQAIVWPFFGDPVPVAGKGRGASRSVVTPPPDLVGRFMGLRKVPPGKILQFARRYGVLGATEAVSRGPDWIEPIERWRSLASQVYSILLLAAALHEDRGISPEMIVGDTPPRCHGVPMAITWSQPEVRYVCPECLTEKPYSEGGPISDRLHLLTDSPEKGGVRQYYWLGNPFPTAKADRARVGWDCLEIVLNDWLRRFPSSICANRDSKKGLEPAVDFRSGLLSVVALQLMQAIARRSMYFCSECKNPFMRHGGSNAERKPRASANKFCGECGHAAALRQADQRRNEKIRCAKKLNREGKSVIEIAVELTDGDTSKVRRMLNKGKR